MTETTLIGLGVGLATGAVFLAAARMVPWAGVRGWAAGAAAAGLVVAGLWAWVSRPGYWETARCGDSLGLAERITTALELGESTSPMAVRQRVDALDHLRSFPAAERMPIRVPVRKVQVLAALAVVSVGLMVWPNPMQAVAEQKAKVASTIHKEEKKIDEVTRKVAQNRSLSPVQRQRILRTLEQLKQELRQAKGAEKALQALSRAEQKLAPPNSGPGTSKMLNDVAQALKSNPATRRLGNKVAQGDLAGIKKELADLEKNIKSLSDKQKQDIAKALADAAKSAGSDKALAEAMAKASRSVPGEDSEAAAESLQQLAGALAAAGQEASGEATMARLQVGLQAAGDTIAEAANASGTMVAGALGGSVDPGSSAGSGTGTGSGSGSGTGSGSGSGSGTGSGTGIGSGQGQGSGSSGAGRGTGNGSEQQGPEAPVGTQGQGAGEPTHTEGQYEKVFDPRLLGAEGNSSQVRGTRGGGPEDVVQTDNSPTSLGMLRPYNEVIADYEREARQTIDRSPVPPSMKDLVKNYFSSLGTGTAH